MGDFDKGFEMVVGVEGGYQSPEQAIINNDPGGETKFGISKKQYPTLDIANLTEVDAKAIYKRDYWDQVKGDQLPFPMNVFVFDAAINQGVDAAIKLIQKTLGVPQDGLMGPNTMKLTQTMSREAMALYMADRALRYTGTRHFDTNGRGWLKRLFIISMGV